MTPEKDTSLSSVAREEMNRLIEVYLEMAEITSGFAVPVIEVLARIFHQGDRPGRLAGAFRPL